jgi:hypothetical protein
MQDVVKALDASEMATTVQKVAPDLHTRKLG